MTLPLTKDDLLFAEAAQPEVVLTINASVSLTARLRGFTKHGLFEVDLTPTTDRVASNAIVRLPDFPIALFVFLTAGTPSRGQCWCRTQLRLGGQAYQTLFSDYLSLRNQPSYPLGRILNPRDGPGAIRSIAGTDPAAGVEISETVPANAVWRLKSFRASLVTSAVAATRQVSIIIDDGTTTLKQVFVNATQAASLTRNYNIMADWALHATAIQAELYAPLPGDLILEAGSRIRTSTVAIDGGDNWGAPQLDVEEWING